MHRTQVSFSEEVYASLKSQAERADISVSELVRRLVERGMKDSVATQAKAFFDQLTPLESFSADKFVRETI